MYIELPEECGLGEGVCGKLRYWLYGFRKAASAWESHYSRLFENIGFERGTWTESMSIILLFSCTALKFNIYLDLSGFFSNYLKVGQIMYVCLFFIFLYLE